MKTLGYNIYNGNEEKSIYWVLHFVSLSICFVPFQNYFSLNFNEYISLGFNLTIFVWICITFILVYLQNYLLGFNMSYPYHLLLKDYLYILLYFAIVTTGLLFNGFGGNYYSLFIIPIAICSVNYGKNIGLIVASTSSIIIITANLLFKYQLGSETFEDKAVMITIMLLMGYLVGSISDQNKINISKIEESKNYLNKLINSLPIGIIIVDKDKKIKFLNKNQEEMLEVDEGAIIGTTINSHECLNLLNNHINDIDSVLSNGKSVDNIYGQLKNFKYKNVDVSMEIHPLQPEQEEVMVIIKDIRSQLEAEKWKTTFELLLQSVDTGIVFIDQSGIIEMCNHAAKDILQIDDSFDIPFKEYLKEKYCLSDTQYKEIYYKQSATLELHHEERVILISKSSINNMSNLLVGDMYVLNDITVIRKADRDIRRAATLSIIGELAAGTAHEIRNPLTVIKGFLQLINSKDSNKTVGDYKIYFDMILGEIERIENVLSEFLQLAKSENKTLSNTSINNIIDDIWGLIQNSALANNIDTKCSLTPDLEFILADPKQIKQVILNIANNACSAVCAGGSVFIKSYRNNKGMICVDIEDNGNGIPEAELTKIFNPFFTTKAEGTGLGLAISNRIMTEHGGEILLSSQISKGSTFTLRFPPYPNSID